jgi:CRP-like cAMP-binding protein
VLRAFEPAERAEIEARMQRRRFRRGQVVFNQGDDGNALHLVVAGHFDVQASTPDGQVVTVRVLRPGDIFGELALVGTGGRRSGRVSALEDGETLALGRGDFEALRRRLPAVDRLLVTALADRLEQTTRQVLELMLPLEARVWRRLLDLCDSYGEGDLALTQDAVARMAGGSRPRVNRVLRGAEQAGVLRLERGHIVVVDRPRLEALAHG